MTHRRPGFSVRSRLAISYATVVVVVGALVLVVVWLYLLRYVPVGNLSTENGHIPDRNDLVRAFVPPAITTLVILLIGGFLGGWYLAGRMLSPLSQLLRATQTITAGALDHRVDLPGRRDEFRMLADSFDSMIDRLAAHVAEQQRFAANASHELRTPLATTRAILDVAMQSSHRAPEKIVQQLRAVNDQAVALTESLLLLARSGAHVLDTEVTDLALLAEEAIEGALPTAAARNVRLDHTITAAPVRGSSALLRQLLANLIHNAIIHNVGPELEGWIQVRTGIAHGRAVAEVENSGFFVSRGLVSTLVEPFQRGTSRQHDGASGAGLGLAIVARIVSSHGGDLTIQAREAGGLRVTADFPIDR